MVDLLLFSRIVNWLLTARRVGGFSFFFNLNAEEIASWHAFQV